MHSLPLQCADAEVRRVAYECISSIAGLYYAKLQPYMEVLFQLTLRTIKDDEVSGHSVVIGGTGVLAWLLRLCCALGILASSSQRWQIHARYVVLCAVLAHWMFAVACAVP
jgi:hypothetical protein